MERRAVADRIARWGFAGVLAVFGLILLGGGGELLLKGGSAYYALAGAAVLASAVSLVRGWRATAMIYGVFLAATLAWSVWEVGLDGWALMPRLVAPGLVGLVFFATPVWRCAGEYRRWWIGVPVLAIAMAMALSVVTAPGESGLPPAKPVAATDTAHGEWRNWGRTLAGQRYAPFDQINASNVEHLALAWQYTSDIPDFGFHSFEATPLAADGRLYLCLDRDVVVALDQDTGHEQWRVDPHTDLTGAYGATCRGVSYYEAPAPIPECQKRVLFSTHDNRLMAVDAETGKACASFGNGGTTNLLTGLGTVPAGYLFPTSPPTIVGGIAVIGNYIIDGAAVDVPSGVVRGYDAVTGNLRWAWDVGHPDRTGLPPEGETYTRSTPNAWSVFSADDGLGLVYLPTGNGSPDYYGTSRTPETEKYSSSIVAVDAATGQVRWSFQTVHHDLWDYDVGSQPVLVDLDGPSGKTPALIAPTKQGELFVLDRRDGHPIDQVVERPAPQNPAPGERLSPTQPHTTGFPSVAGPDLREQDMWGLTPLDQLWCRIAFKSMRYDGVFTPPSLRPAITYPGAGGGVDWGSATVDPDRGLLVVSTLQSPTVGYLIPRTDAAKMSNGAGSAPNKTFLYPQEGTPYVYLRWFMISPLAVPCNRPPFGTISVFDIASRKLVWSKPIGTAERSGPFGLELHLPIRLGVPALGGSVATAGGLVFFGAGQDRVLHAYDIANGREVWHATLPAVGGAVPMSFVSQRTGRQYVVIAAGGSPAYGPPYGGHVLAFTLPKGAPPSGSGQ